MHMDVWMNVCMSAHACVEKCPLWGLEFRLTAVIRLIMRETKQDDPMHC